MNGEKILKVTSIIMIIGGVLAFILGIIAVVGVAALSELLDETEGGKTLLYVSSIFVLLSGLIELIAGIVGVTNCNKPEKAGSCIVLGAIVAILCVVGQVINLIAGSGINFVSLIVGLVLPVLYIIGAMQNKKLASQ